MQVASTAGNSSSSLIEALRQVWAPTLQSTGLNSTLIKKLEDDIFGPGKPSTLIEEESFWKKHGDKTKTNSRQYFKDAQKIIGEIRVELESAETSRDGLSGVEEILEIVGLSIDDIWKLGTADSVVYNEERMKNLFNIIGDQVVSLVKILLDEYRAADVRTKDEAFHTASLVCKKWIDICGRNTSIFWPHYSLHPWKNEIFVPPKCEKFAKRLRQTSEIRMQHRQLTRLLTEPERLSLGTENLLQSFDDLKIVLGDEDKDWKRLRKRFEDDIAPAEERVTEKLKKQISNAASPVLLVGEFQRYAELMKRERVKMALRGEREALMGTLDNLIEIYQSGPDAAGLLDIPKILQQVQAARSAEIKLQVLKDLSDELISDLPDYKDGIAKISSALKEAEARRQNLVESWVLFFIK